MYGINKLIFFSGYVEIQTNNIAVNLKLIDFNIPNPFAISTYFSIIKNNGGKQFCHRLQEGTKSCIVDTTPSVTINAGEYYIINGFNYTI